MAAGSDYYLAAPPYPHDSYSRSADGSPFHSGGLPLAPVFAGASAAWPAAWPAASAVLAGYWPVDSAPDAHAAPAQGTSHPSPRSFPAPAAIPRIGISVSSLVTLSDSGFVPDSDSHRSCHQPVPAVATRSTRQNPKSHHNFPAPTCSG